VDEFVVSLSGLSSRLFVGQFLVTDALENLDHSDSGPARKPADAVAGVQDEFVLAAITQNRGGLPRSSPGHRSLRFCTSRAA
jgi:hypothetical protein